MKKNNNTKIINWTIGMILLHVFFVLCFWKGFVSFQIQKDLEIGMITANIFYNISSFFLFYLNIVPIFAIEILLVMSVFYYFPRYKINLVMLHAFRTNWLFFFFLFFCTCLYWFFFLVINNFVISVYILQILNVNLIYTPLQIIIKLGISIYVLIPIGLTSEIFFKAILKKTNK